MSHEHGTKSGCGKGVCGVDHICGFGSVGVQTVDELSFSRGLWLPAMNGNLSKLKEVLEVSTQKINNQDSSGYTALHYACR